MLRFGIKEIKEDRKRQEGKEEEEGHNIGRKQRRQKDTEERKEDGKTKKRESKQTR